jgi:quercetin dioxygenase-like cupin family protein
VSDAPEVVDLLALPASGDGVAWSANPDGVNVNLVVLAPGGAIPAHRNDAVDVLVLVLDGTLDVEVDSGGVELRAGHATVVPRGATRTLSAGAGGSRHLTVHRERPPMQPARR